MNTETPTRSSGMEIAKGIASCFALNLLHLGIAWLLLIIAAAYADFLLAIVYVLIAGFGLLQLVYVIPLVVTFQRKGRPNFAKGVAIGASLAFLLSATCWGLIMTGNIQDL